MKAQSLPLKNIQLNSNFWTPRLKLIHDVVIPYQWEAMNDRLEDAAKSGAVQNFKIAAGREQGEFCGCPFQDSDLAKWLEAVSYCLSAKPDSKLEQLAYEVIDLIADAQDENGYLVTRYIIKDQDQRWTNLRDEHELYVIGHQIEAAVAYLESTGKDKFLKIVQRAADHVAAVFGRQSGQLRGYPGHEEIELALVKLFQVTGENKYLELSRYFIDERGREPNYFVEEAIRRGESGKGKWGGGLPDYYQAHLPVREQTTAEGHAVRAMYLFSAMADVACETGDEELTRACHRLWDNVVQRRMYVTGGIGSTHHGEAFTFDYDLPNETSYAETCAAIGLMFFAHRMLKLDMDRQFADVMERALYNGVLSGISLDGTHYFYVNPLAAFPKDKYSNAARRQPWYGCACCPPNLARLLSSLGKYCYSQQEDTLYLHLYAGGSVQFIINGSKITLEQRTEYPWQEKVNLRINTKGRVNFTLALRIPGWCRQSNIKVNQTEIDISKLLNKGYVYLSREWSQDDNVELFFAMQVEKIEAHPSVRMNAGRVALQRGPVVYCIEQVDNGADLNDIILSAKAEFKVKWNPDLLGGVPVIFGAGCRRDRSRWENQLYRFDSSSHKKITVRAIPYALWANRDQGEMLVWVRDERYFSGN
ncbi:MAG: glycoside hydrolase family 127 protein [bacterium]|nr:glycoside hydrolase family 127 protein [bacterium]